MNGGKEHARREGTTRKSSRRRSRELALQGLYQWLLSHKDSAMIAAELAEAEGFSKSDTVYFRTLLDGAIASAAVLEASIEPLLDRPLKELSPIERGILMLSGYELMHELEVPYRVVINEAIELARIYGGTDGHKFVNGVLDKLAARVRELEVRGERAARSPTKEAES